MGTPLLITILFNHDNIQEENKEMYQLWCFATLITFRTVLLKLGSVKHSHVTVVKNMLCLLLSCYGHFNQMGLNQTSISLKVSLQIMSNWTKWDLLVKGSGIKSFMTSINSQYSVHILIMNLIFKYLDYWIKNIFYR